MMQHLCGARYHWSLWILHRAFPAPVLVLQSKEQSECLFFSKETKNQSRRKLSEHYCVYVDVIHRKRHTLVSSGPLHYPPAPCALTGLQPGAEFGCSCSAKAAESPQYLALKESAHRIQIQSDRKGVPLNKRQEADRTNLQSHGAPRTASATPPPLLRSTPASFPLWCIQQSSISNELQFLFLKGSCGNVKNKKAPTRLCCSLRSSHGQLPHFSRTTAQCRLCCSGPPVRRSASAHTWQRWPAPVEKRPNLTLNFYQKHRWRVYIDLVM